MSETDIIMPAEEGERLPTVLRIGVDDIKEALISGTDDFWAMPTHVIFLALIYPIVGLLLAYAILGLDLMPLLYPLAAGFALIGPIAAIGLYELSRRREMGLDTSWRHAFDVVYSPSFRAVVTLGFLLFVLFAVWIITANEIYVANFGYHKFESIGAFADALFNTPEGRRVIVYGNVIGGLYAVLAFVVSVVSFPMLLDRHVSAAAAVATSLKVVAINPVPMACWAAIIAAGLIIGSLPFLVGLAIVMPVLGHASWHLYRRVVEPPRGPRPPYHPPEKGRRYAADFPASLFARSRDRER
ncbi:MAG: hypothetical protein DIU65_07140 [Proteobacteria bacterium]|nr:MAG: hypothetical protein DIU65_07140 [Pseudomonadota bacterium]